MMMMTKMTSSQNRGAIPKHAKRTPVSSRNNSLMNGVWSTSTRVTPSVNNFFNSSSYRVSPGYFGPNNATNHSRPSRIKVSNNSNQNPQIGSNNSDDLPIVNFNHFSHTNTKPTTEKLTVKKSKFKKIFFVILAIVVLIILLFGIAFAIYASLNDVTEGLARKKPCSLTKCHSKASLCIDRFPFWAQCICNPGFAGNGKTHCDKCGRTTVQPNVMRIVGGVEASKNSWPYAVYIIQNYKGRYSILGSNFIISYSWSCGGTIINHKTILTAAHCIHDQTFEYEDDKNNLYSLLINWNEWYSSLESTFDVYIGIHSTSNLDKNKRYRVKKVYKNDNYEDEDLRNDIAILQLEDLIEMSSSAQFSCLPYSFSSDYPMPNKDAYILGWGRTSERSGASNVLRNSKIKILDSDDCTNVENKMFKNWDAQICAGVLDGTSDTCQGDSGGGLFILDNLNTTSTNSSLFVISGIVSYGDGCARVGKPGIYSRTSYYLDWIRKYSDF